MLYPGLSVEDKIRRIAGHGFSAVEFWGWRDKDIPRTAEVCRSLGVTVANFSGHRRGSPVARETHEAFLEDLRDASRAAKRLECPVLMVLSNELGEGGVVLDSWDRIPPDEKFSSFVEALSRAFDEVLPDGISLVVEPLNTKKDHSGNYLTDLETAASLLDAVGHPRLKILADFYHLAMMGEYPAELARRYAGRIGHVHIAEVPNRDEPAEKAGGVSWVEVLKILRNEGYEGCIGFEYAPGLDSDDSLEAVRKFCNAAGL
jgi:hydroxypyruvate isomerase